MLAGPVTDPAQDTEHGKDQVIEDKKHSPPRTPPSPYKATRVEDQSTQTEALGEDEDRKTESLKEDKGNEATTAVDRKTSQAQSNCTATSSSKV